MSIKISDKEFELYANGSKLYGDDFTHQQILKWYQDEEHASYDIYKGVDTTQYDALNWYYAYRHLDKNFYAKCVALGIADGKDIEPFAKNIGEIFGIEPEERWWRNNIGNTKAKYLKPAIDGKIPLENNSCDLSICLGVLHHIPNVSYVLGELSRVLKKDGVALFREPVTMMGDFRFSRPRMSPHERGIPPGIFKKILKDSGMHIKQLVLFDNPIVSRSAQKIGINKPYDSKFIIKMDSMASQLFAWNMHYYPKNIFNKISPSSAFIIAVKK